jgi:hypothetical protein
MLLAICQYLSAAIVTFIVGSVIGSQMVLSSLGAMGLEVTLSQRLSVTWQDIVGLSTSLLPMMALSQMLAWWILEGIGRRTRLAHAALLYALLGGLSIVALHLVLRQIFGVDAYAPARSIAGLMGQAAAGAMGGWWLARFRLSGQAG